MSVVLPDLRLPRNRFWKWWVCGLLLLATMINYMDRLTLNLMSEPLMKTFGLTEGDYGLLESAFGTAFAFGAIIMGWCADRWNVRWLYPLAVIVWSLAGFATGLVQSFLSLLLCRFLLGLAEAGNWPCALRTTQRILAPTERTLGNSILQSGAALGAVLTPLLILGLLHVTASWRLPFMVVGAIGMTWAALWLLSVNASDLQLERTSPAPSLLGVLVWLVLLYSVDVGVHVVVVPGNAGTLSWMPLVVKCATTGLGILGVSFWLRSVTRADTFLPRKVFFRRFWVLATVVVTINLTWHYFRAWLPRFLIKQHGYNLEENSLFFMFYYLASDVGSLTAGFAVLALARQGLSVHGSRLTVFALGSVLTTLSLVAAFLPAGPLLLGVLLLLGFAALALFPSYYSFSQELTVQHQGKLTGALGCICWLSMSLLHEVAGEAIMRTGSYSQGVGLAGLAPLIGLVALVFFWGKTPPTRQEPVPEIEVKAPRLQTEAIKAENTGVRE